MKRILILMAVFAANVAHGQTPVGFSTNCPTCVNGQCGPVQQAAHNVVSYAGNVGNAIVQPFRERPALFPRLRTVIQNRPRLFVGCR